MNPTGDRFEKMREKTRARIREAAVALFAQKGLEATSVADIAETAGVSAGLIYRHYRAKDDLFIELADEARAGLASLRAAFEAGEPVPTIGSITQDICRDMTQDGRFLNIMIIITRALLMNDARLQPLIEEDKAMLAALAGMIARGQRAGDFRAGDARAMACAYIATVQGAFVMRAALGADFCVPTPEVLQAAICEGRD
ncbi:MAG: TetR/AcrR family transcriptional regulator [Christensenellales bacterium]